MMLTTSFFAPSMQYHSAYTPSRTSPLAERSVNAVPRLFDFSMASQPNEKKTPMSKRAYKPNPLIQSRDAATKRRRDMFFNRVQNSREDKHWEKRGEQIQQLDFVSERKRWEAEKARQAPPENDEIDEEDMEDASLPEMSEADYIAAQEEYDLQQLISSMEPGSDANSQHYGSDDDDYDSIFMECAVTVDENYQQQSHLAQAIFDTEDVMDVDMIDG